MEETLVDEIVEELRSRMKALKGNDYHIDVFVKDGRSFLIFESDAFFTADAEFERKLP